MAIAHACLRVCSFRPSDVAGCLDAGAARPQPDSVVPGQRLPAQPLRLRTPSLQQQRRAPLMSTTHTIAMAAAATGVHGVKAQEGITACSRKLPRPPSGSPGPAGPQHNLSRGSMGGQVWRQDVAGTAAFPTPSAYFHSGCCPYADLPQGPAWLINKGFHHHPS